MQLDTLIVLLNAIKFTSTVSEKYLVVDEKLYDSVACKIRYFSRLFSLFL